MNKRNIILIFLLLLQIQHTTFAQEDSYTQFLKTWDKQISKCDMEIFDLKLGEFVILLTEKAKPYRDKNLIYKQTLWTLGDYCKDILLPDISHLLAVKSFEDNLDYFLNNEKMAKFSKEEYIEYAKYMGDAFTLIAQMNEYFYGKDEIQSIEKEYIIATDYYRSFNELAKEYTPALGKFACFYMRIGEYGKALEKFQEEISKNKKTKVLSAEELIATENKMAYCYLMTQQLPKAEKILKKLIKTKKVPHQRMVYALIIHNSANLSLLKNDTTQALSLIRQAMKIYKHRAPSWKDISKSYTLPESFTLLRHSAHLFQQKKMTQQASFIYRFIDSMLIHISERSLSELGDKNIMWNTIHPLIDEILIFAYQNNDGKLMFDTSIIYKSLFYTYFSSQYQNDYYSDPFFKSTKELLKQLLQISFNTNDYLDDNKFWPIVKWNIRQKNLENILTSYCQSNNLVYQISGDRAGLSEILFDDEAVIEFVTFPNPDKKEKTLCCAIVFDKTNQSTNIIPLCSKEELDCILQKSPKEQLTGLSDSFWKPIEKGLKGYKRLYLSISDEFSNIPFAGIKVGEEYLFDKYKLYTISHPNNIINIKAKKELPIDSISKIYLFGGADFGLPPSFIGNQTRGQGFAYLPGSKQEVDTIAKLFKEKSKNVISFTGTSATKHNLESLSFHQQSPSILHISTHGFFVPFINEDNKGNTSKVTNAYNRFFEVMKRCGVALTGANNAWTNKDSVDCQSNNGILTSQELSTINLSTTELVVLSSCHSGKEESSLNGLTCGIKRALSSTGAHSLLAALWAIPDKESAEMMKEFYTQWLSGLSKRDAFDKALQKMRENYPNAPEKWAVFTLME